MDYSKRLNLLHAICLAETYHDGGKPNIDLNSLNAEESAHYLASFLTFRAIQAAGRQPADELKNNFEMLSVYQCFGVLIFAFLTLPIINESANQAAFTPNLDAAQIVIGKTLFDGISDAQMVEIIQSGYSKFKLIGDADAEHWSEFRENLDKLTVSFVIAGTDDDSPHSKEDVLPIFGQMLSQLCEAFESA